MSFRRAAQRYGRTPEPDTPFARAGRLWDERLGQTRAQARNWRIMAFGSLALAGGLGTALVWQSAQNRITPYVVEVDRLGEARAVAPAEAAYHPTDPQIAWFLGSFIRDVRTVSLDPVLMRANWLLAYDLVTKRGGVSLSDYARAAQPFAHLGEETVAVQVTSVVRASETSFQVKWTETRFDQGAAAGVTHWTAILTLVLHPPSSAEALRRNPLGLYIDAIDWTAELEPGPAGTAVPAALPAPAPPAPLAAPPASPSLPPARNPSEIQP